MDNSYSYNVIFLAYVARSGSTFFAKQLSLMTDEILVVAETKLIDNIALCSEHKFSALSSKEKLELIYSDPRWQNLGIPVINLMSICSRDLSRADFIDQIIQTKLKINNSHSKPKLVLIKSGSVIWNFQEVKTLFNDISLVHVWRDPRGSVASRMNKMPIYKKTAGARLGDSWFLAKFWKGYISKVKELEHSGVKVLDIEYEQLVSDSYGTVKKFLSSFNLEITNAVSNSFNLSDAEKQSKHANVEKAPMTSRLEAWKNELNEVDGVIVEYICSDWIVQKYFSRYTAVYKQYVYIVYGFIRHFLINVRRVIEKLIEKNKT